MNQDKQETLNSKEIESKEAMQKASEQDSKIRKEADNKNKYSQKEKQQAEPKVNSKTAKKKSKYR